MKSVLAALTLKRSYQCLPMLMTAITGVFPIGEQSGIPMGMKALKTRMIPTIYLS